MDEALENTHSWRYFNIHEGLRGARPSPGQWGPKPMSLETYAVMQEIENKHNNYVKYALKNEF